MERKEFDFYESLKEISNEIENCEDYQDSIILKKLIYFTSCEIATFFTDNIFISDKLKFKSFDDNKKFTKVMLDILYQILKQFSLYPFRCIINLFETLNLGNYEIDSMIFFLKTELTFYFTHQLVMVIIKEELSIELYEINFRKKFNEGFNNMKDLIKLIPLFALCSNNEKMENISIPDSDYNIMINIFRINCPEDFKNSINKTLSSSGILPPIRNRPLSNSSDHFFTTLMEDKKSQTSLDVNK